MAHTTKVPLGAATYNRKWYLDVNTGTYDAPNWVGVFGVSDFKPVVEPTLQKDSDYDSGGWGSQTPAAINWSIEMNLQRKVTTALATAYDPGQEALRAYAPLFGTSNQADVRWYEVTSGGPIAEAYRGYAAVTWTENGGPEDGLAAVTCKLVGRGARTAITHPDYAAGVPILYSITPATDVEAGGLLCKLKGANFFAAGVDDVVSIAFGATDAPSYSTLDDQTIFVNAPAHTAGTVAVTVTNATGVSTVTVNFVYTVA